MSTDTTNTSDYTLSESEESLIKDLEVYLKGLPIRSYRLEEAITNVINNAQVVVNHPNDNGGVFEMYESLEELEQSFRNNFYDIRLFQYRQYFEIQDHTTDNNKYIYNNKRDFFNFINTILEICKRFHEKNSQKNKDVCNLLIEKLS